MVLHLLGKKSWHVYNSANVERVRRDEAAAQAREEAAEQLSLEQDARRRMQLLRGEVVDDDGGEGSEARRESRRDEDEKPRDQVQDRHDRPRKRRRGEDDTDRDIRVAREAVGQRFGGDHEGESSLAAQKQVMLLPERERDAPLQDHAGHFQLIPAPDEARLLETSQKHGERNSAQGSQRHRRRDAHRDDPPHEGSAPSKPDDQPGGMRFSDAAGYGKRVSRPWYASATGTTASSKSVIEPLLAAAPVHNVFGREDPRRREREGARIASSDPFAAMQQAQRQLKQSARDKAGWQQAREAEVTDAAVSLRESRRAKSRRRRHRSRTRSRERGEKRRERDREGHRQRDDHEDDRDSLEGFSLDADADAPERPQQSEDSHRHHDRSRSHRQHRDRDREHDEHHRHDHNRRRDHHRRRSRSRSPRSRRDRDHDRVTSRDR